MSVNDPKQTSQPTRSVSAYKGKMPIPVLAHLRHIGGAAALTSQFRGPFLDLDQIQHSCARNNLTGVRLLAMGIAIRRENLR